MPSNSPAAHQTTPTAFAAVGRWLLRLKEAEQRDRELQLASQRLELESRKFEFNAARQALIHAQDLQTILNHPTADNEDKIWAAREKLFGPRSLLIEPPEYTKR